MANGVTEAKASYRVAIPFRNAMHKAFEKRRPESFEGA